MDGRDGSERSLLELLLAAGLSSSIEPGDHACDVRITSLTADSRKVRAGSCFVAVAGSQHDGRAFIEEAVRAGGVAVVSEGGVALPSGVGSVRVRDARSALSRLAAAYHGFAPGQKHAGMALIGVTGTNGKTTTCALLRSILEASGRCTALLGTIQYDLVGETRSADWTTPPPVELYECLSVAAEHGATHAVMEVSSHALSQARCDGHRFAGAVFTNLSGDHLDYHADVASYAAAKKRLFDGLDDGAFAVVNADDAKADYMVKECAARVVRFGFRDSADVTATVETSDVTGNRFVLRTPSGSTPVGLSLVGRHGVANAMAAAAAAVAKGIEIEAIRAGLEALEVVPGRLERIDTGDRGFGLFVDYAHTDDALVNVLSALRPLTVGRLICVFGCGGDRDRSKRARMAEAVAEGADVAIVTSDNPRSEDPEGIIEDICGGFTAGQRCIVVVEVDRGRAIERAVAMADRGDMALIAGKGHEDYQIVGGERRHFSDVLVASECLEARGDRAP